MKMPSPPHPNVPAEKAALVLIVEDDPTILRGLKDSFSYEGYETRTAVDGHLALSLAQDIAPDIILLDIMLPGMNGFEICKALRDRQVNIPIIMLTAKSQEEDIILGLNLGADDYVTKPFRIQELHARVRRLLDRQERHRDEQTIRFGPYEIELANRVLRRNDQVIDLQPKEFDLLLFFVRHPERAITREQILDHVWGEDVFVADRSVDRCVTNLRKKLEADPRRPRWIKTLHRVGYRFEPR